ncbi:MAG TPA: SpoIID/LytB domain-containing protein [Candidatus Saccharimonadales bacterium]|nr:SpoIID/LytB domain-containing protein [Candidatus Saccharimonadales bacterium]
MRKLAAFFLVLIFSLFVFVVPTHADEISDLQKQIDSLSSQLDQSKKATTPLESEVKSLQAQFDSIQAKIAQLQKQLQQSEDDLEFQKKVMARTVRNFYMNSFTDIPLLTILASGDATDTLKLIAYQQESSTEDKQTISNIGERISKLADDKKRLASASLQINKQSQFLRGQIASAKSFQSQLAGQIAQLSARQQEIISAKSGTFTTSVGDVPLADDPNSAPSYNPGFSPAFAPFSFGAYSHRNGMSQYGAKALAADKNYKDIIQWYYGHGVKKDDGMPSSINVQGYGDMDFQKYLYGIAEMPSSWPGDALKAQAVAARTYAKGAGKPICTTESCQVFSKSKSDNPPDSWKAAVDATNKEVIDGDVSAQYSSTTGGWINTNGGFWDTKCRAKDCWTADAYEKIAGSPWFYKGWYTQSYSSSSDKCGKSSPWLTGEEMADILNAWLIQGKDGIESGRITPVTTSCWGGNPYSMSDLRNLADAKAGGAVSSVSSVSVSYGSNGSTANVSFSTNKGSISISGSDFKTIFNLRAPGYISLRSPLYNLEQK